MIPVQAVTNSTHQIGDLILIPGRIRLRVFICFLFLLRPLFLAVGQDKTQYNLFNVPQTINLNPALQIKCDHFILLPAISEIQFFYRNNGFSWNQIATAPNRSVGDSLVINPDRLSKVLGKRNQIRVGTGLSLFGFGFRSGNWYFSVNASNRSSFLASFPRDLIDARDGNWDLTTNTPRQINLNGLGIHFIDYTEFAFGASKKVFNGFYLGGRIKVLFGAAHIQTKSPRISLTTTASPIEIMGRSNILLRSSLPLTLTYNRNGFVNRVDSPVTQFGDIMPYFFSGNYGGAIDAGVIYEYDSQLTLSASILDLGLIRWRKNINILNQNETFVFSGFDLNNYLRNGSQTDLLQAFKDSVTDNFRLSNSNAPYFAFIPARLFASAEYRLNGLVQVAGIFEAEWLSGRLSPGLTLTSILKPLDALTFSLSYSLMDRAYDDIGFSVVAGQKNIQFYFVTDKIPVSYVKDKNTGLFWPYSARTLNFRFGINILFGCKNNNRPGYRPRGRSKYCPAYR